MSSTRPRILFIAAHLLYDVPNSGGDVLFMSIARYLAKQHPNWELGVAAPAFAADGLRRSFETVVPIPVPPGEQQEGLRDRAHIAAAWFRRIGPAISATRKWKPHLVHTTGDFFPNVLVARALHRRDGARWSGVVHHINPAPFRRRTGVFTAAASFALQRLSFAAMQADCERIALLNAETRDELQRIGFAPERLRLVGAGIEPDRFPLHEKPPQGKRVLWVHRLDPTKGIADLPQVVARLPNDIAVDVVGEGLPAVRRWLADEFNRLGVAHRAVVHGYVTNERLADLYANARAFISCSYEEGWGISICEALASGIPSLAYALGSHREIFGNALATVPVGDVAAFAAKLTEIVQMPDSPQARRERHDRVAGYTMEAAAGRQGRVFEELLAQGAPLQETAAAGHITEVSGPVQALRAYLGERRRPVAFARHPFAYTSLDESTFEVWRDGKIVRTRTWSVPKPIALLRDVLANLLWFGPRPASNVFIGIDNVNAFCGILLRWLGRTKAVVYYVIDYTPRRFDSDLVNAVYHWADRFAIKHADVVWNISERIAAIRRNQGVPPQRNKVVGVGVDLGKIRNSQPQRRHDLVVVSHLTESKGVQLAIEAMDDIVARVPDSRLIIVGVGPYESALRELAARQRSASSIVFTGLMQHDELFSYLPGCGIAVATYVDAPGSITYYADPTKPKEYLACGLPVLITDVPWIAQFIQERPMGRCIPYERSAYVAAAIELLTDTDLYERCRRNALEYAAGLAWSTIYDAAFADLAAFVPSVAEVSPRG